MDEPTTIKVESGGNFYECPNARTIRPVTHNHFPGRPTPYTLRITEIINILSRQALDLPPDNTINADAFYIEQKLRHNCLRRWAHEVREHTAYTAFLTEIYAEYDRQGCNKSQNVMRWLRSQYRRLSDDDTGDLLFDNILQAACEAVWNDPQRQPDLMLEDIDTEMRIVLVDAFVKCEIFEKPPLAGN